MQYKDTTRVDAAPESVNMRALIGPKRVVLDFEYYALKISLTLTDEQAQSLLGMLRRWHEES